MLRRWRACFPQGQVGRPVPCSLRPACHSHTCGIPWPERVHMRPAGLPILCPSSLLRVFASHARRAGCMRRPTAHLLRCAALHCTCGGCACWARCGWARCGWLCLLAGRAWLGTVWQPDPANSTAVNTPAGPAGQWVNLDGSEQQYSMWADRTAPAAGPRTGLMCTAVAWSGYLNSPPAPISLTGSSGSAVAGNSSGRLVMVPMACNVQLPFLCRGGRGGCIQGWVHTGKGELHAEVGTLSAYGICGHAPAA